MLSVEISMLFNIFLKYKLWILKVMNKLFVLISTFFILTNFISLDSLNIFSVFLLYAKAVINLISNCDTERNVAGNSSIYIKFKRKYDETIYFSKTLFGLWKNSFPSCLGAICCGSQELMLGIYKMPNIFMRKTVIS